MIHGLPDTFSIHSRQLSGNVGTLWVNLLAFSGCILNLVVRTLGMRTRTITALGHDIHPFNIYILCPFVLGFPLIIVIISACVLPGGYGTESSCWLSTDQGLIWAFAGPVAAITVVSIIEFQCFPHPDCYK
jgi:hypothetical protein